MKPERDDDAQHRFNDLPPKGGSKVKERPPPPQIIKGLPQTQKADNAAKWAALKSIGKTAPDE